ncbi:MAG: NAD(P)-dependent oxidoreductase [Bradyrhizobiaceae bacterium]|nr:NAD(P)-dependent oxidoreductase [Bradyrhizobiaceae bacterium]
MKIAVIGASGRQGSRIVNEAVDRGHTVTGIARNADKVPSRAGVTAKAGDINDPGSVAQLLKGHDAVISSVRFAQTNAANVLSAVKQSGVKRLLVVGGASSLEVSPGVRLIDTPGFPEAARPEAQAGIEFLDAIRNERELDWVFVSPGALLQPGERLGRYRLERDTLLKDENGKSGISMEDFAIAMIDELENHKHSRTRFHVAY